MEILEAPPPDLGNLVHKREMPSNVDLVAPAVVRISDFMYEQGWIREDQQGRLELCLDEALRNAVIHGNNREFSRKVHIRLFSDGERWSVWVRDQGGGFSADCLQNGDLEESLWKEGGRGIRLIEHYMEEVTYYEGGRCLVIRGRLNST